MTPRDQSIANYYLFLIERKTKVKNALKKVAVAFAMTELEVKKALNKNQISSRKESSKNPITEQRNMLIYLLNKQYGLAPDEIGELIKLDPSRIKSLITIQDKSKA